MNFDEFATRLADNYPVLYSYDKVAIECHIGGVGVGEFIDIHHIKPTTESYTSYKDVWTYIAANEHMHDWWLL